MVRERYPLTSLACAVALFGCTSTPNPGLQDSGTPDAGSADSGPADGGLPDGGPSDGGLADGGLMDAGVDGAICASDAHPLDGGGCDSELSWDAGTAFPSPRDHHVTFLLPLDAGAFLYVAGGNNYVGRFGDVYLAPIWSDGTLGDWSRTTPLPSGRAGHSAEVSGTEVFIISGMGDTGTDLKSVLTSQAQPDGTLGPWIATTALPFGRFHLATALFNGWIYLTGGLDDQFKSSDQMLGAMILSDGTLSAWQTLTALPGPRDHHSSFAFADHLYVVGGGHGDPVGNQSTAYNDILSAPINADGTLGSWSEVSTIDVDGGVETQANFVHEGMLYLLGGLESVAGPNGTETTDVTAHVRRAPIASDGSLGPWQEVSPLPMARAHVHQTPVYNGRVYSVCGSTITQQVLPDVSIGTFQ